MPIDPCNVVSYAQEAPLNTATTLVFEDPFSWVVLCEGGCMKHLRVSKYRYVQTDFSVLVTDPNDASYNRLDLTAPHAVLCITCGPNGEQWRGWPWEQFTYGKLARQMGIFDLAGQERFLRWATREAHRYQQTAPDSRLSLYEVVPAAFGEHLREAVRRGHLQEFID